MVIDEKDVATLLDAVKYFANQDVSREFLASLRWPDGIVCHRCGSENIGFLNTRKLWKCRDCKKQFSVKVGSLFEDSPIGLDKWLPTLWLLVNCKNGVSSYEIARDIGVTQETAWFMLHRLRLALQVKSFDKIDSEIEIDETYIGGKARNMHKGRKARIITGTGGMGKVAVMGLLERHGPDGHSTVRTQIVKSTKRRLLQAAIRANVEKDAGVH